MSVSFYSHLWQNDKGCWKPLTIKWKGPENIKSTQKLFQHQIHATALTPLTVRERRERKEEGKNKDSDSAIQWLFVFAVFLQYCRYHCISFNFSTLFTVFLVWVSHRLSDDSMEMMLLFVRIRCLIIFPLRNENLSFFAFCYCFLAKCLAQVKGNFSLVLFIFSKLLCLVFFFFHFLGWFKCLSLGCFFAVYWVDWEADYIKYG